MESMRCRLRRRKDVVGIMIPRAGAADDIPAYRAHAGPDTPSFVSGADTAPRKQWVDGWKRTSPFVAALQPARRSRSRASGRATLMAAPARKRFSCTAPVGVQATLIRRWSALWATPTHGNSTNVKILLRQISDRGDTQSCRLARSTRSVQALLLSPIQTLVLFLFH